MPTHGRLFTAGPEAVPHTVRRHCSLCASEKALKALQLPRCQEQASLKRLAPVRSSAFSSSPAARATQGVRPAAVRNTALPNKPQVLAPAGGWPQLKAAVENGADAVYLGLSDFNARARAVNFTPEELPEVRAALHLTLAHHKHEHFNQRQRVICPGAATHFSMKRSRRWRRLHAGPYRTASAERYQHRRLKLIRPLQLAGHGLSARAGGKGLRYPQRPAF